MELMKNIERLILKKICNDESFARKTLPFVKLNAVLNAVPA